MCVGVSLDCACICTVLCEPQLSRCVVCRQQPVKMYRKFSGRFLNNEFFHILAKKRSQLSVCLWYDSALLYQIVAKKQLHKVMTCIQIDFDDPRVKGCFHRPCHILLPL